MTHFVGAYIPEAKRNALRAIAYKQRVTVSTLFREAIDRFLEN